MNEYEEEESEDDYVPYELAGVYDVGWNKYAYCVS